MIRQWWAGLQVLDRCLVAFVVGALWATALCVGTYLSIGAPVFVVFTGYKP